MFNKINLRTSLIPGFLWEDFLLKFNSFCSYQATHNFCFFVGSVLVTWVSLSRNLFLLSILSNLMAQCYDFLVSIGSPYIGNLYLLYYFSLLVWVAVYQFYWSLQRIAFGYIHFFFCWFSVSVLLISVDCFYFLLFA